MSWVDEDSLAGSVFEVEGQLDATPPIFCTELQTAGSLGCFSAYSALSVKQERCQNGKRAVYAERLKGFP